MTTKIFYEIKPVKEKLWLNTRKRHKNADWVNLKSHFCDMLANCPFYTEIYPTRKMLIEKMAINELIALCTLNA